MRIQGQKNVYYIDLARNVYRGYIETRVFRTTSEVLFTYKSAHLAIDRVQILGEAVEPTLVQLSDFSFQVRIPPECSLDELTLHIAFHPSTTNSQIFWYRPVSESDKHREVVAMPSADSSGIAPYIDTPTNLELIYITPSSEEVTVISPGNLQAIMEKDNNTMHSYKLLVHPRHLLFSVGTYSRTEIFNDYDSRHILVPYSLAAQRNTHHASDLDDLLSDLQSILTFIDSFTKCKTLSSLMILFSFIDTQPLIAPNVVILPITMLPSSRDIEPAYFAKRQIAELLSSVVFDFLDWDILDSWIPKGLSGYLADHCVRQLLGVNEYLYEYNRTKEYVIENDVLEPPLFYSKRAESTYNSKFFKAKSKLVFHCMEVHLSAAFLQKIAEEVVNMKEYQITGTSQYDEKTAEEPENNKNLIKTAEVFTPRFARLIKSTSGKDLGSFLEFYVFFPGLLKITLKLQITRKKNSVQVAVIQTPTSRLPGCNRKYSHPILVKTMETEGTFEHSIAADGETVFFYHARTKKKKKEEADEDNTMPLLFIRADPKRETLFQVTVEQPDYMFVEQLSEKSIVGQLEAIEALKNKPSAMSCEALEKLLDNAHTFYHVRIRAIYALRNVNIGEYNGMQRLLQYFIRTRCVSTSTVLKANEFGLIPYFIQKHLVIAIATPVFSEKSKNEIVSLSAFSSPLALNDPSISSGISNLFELRKEMEEEHRTVISFLKHILQFNDNSQSQFDDSWYIASVINLLSIRIIELLKITNNKDHQTHCTYLLNEIERLRVLDMVFPSKANVITCTCLVVAIRLFYAGYISLNQETLLSLAKYPNIHPVRLIAIEGLAAAGDVRSAINIIKGEPRILIDGVLRVFLSLLEAGITTSFEGLEEALKKELAGGDTQLLRRIAEFIDGKQLSMEKYATKCVEEFSLVGEEVVRNQINRVQSGVRRLKVTGLQELRVTLLQEEGLVRIPRAGQTQKRKPNFILRLPTTKYVPRRVNELVFKLRLSERKLLRNEDIAILIPTKLCELSGAENIENVLQNPKNTEFFEWFPLPFARIREMALLAHQDLRKTQTVNEVKETATGAMAPSYYQEQTLLHTVHRLVEHSLVYLLSYTSHGSKFYNFAKIAFNVVERLVYKNTLIPEWVTAMSKELRDECAKWIEEMLENPEYLCFRDPVDFTELKSYLDIVRIPMCFFDVSEMLKEGASYDVFVCAVERISRNCLNFNRAKSPIALTAKELLGEFDSFRERMLEEVDIGSLRRTGRSLISEIVREVDTDGMFRKVVHGVEGGKIRAWGELDEELENCKRAAGGKNCTAVVKEIKRRLALYFPINSGKLIWV